ncbi:hypothetical protein P3T36_000955 [Kitasatospora sp. MAP12-15]|uniref:hypothetical protein n=1 Tax=unclassified Kitasatospora TaxID=2633591 RepID=UPI0024760FEA|nr:hypothetical protein [Kitasatospora sp. MAP12-44]MDH6114555.1 hypothetical protein [Kitasatospora sp. MAP12-44]
MIDLRPLPLIDLRPLPPQDRALPPQEARAAARLLDGVRGADGPWRPTRPLHLRADAYHRIGELSVRAARLVLAACRRRARTAGELLAALGSRPELFPLLDHRELLGEHLLAAVRPDILLEDGVPRFVELNIDGALGGVRQADLLAARFLDHHRRSASGSGSGSGDAVACTLSAPPSAVDARARTIRGFLGLPDGATVLLPHYLGGTLAGLESLERFAEWLAPVFENAHGHGMEMFTFPLDRLTADPHGRLLAGERAVDAVFRPFVSHGQPDSPGLRALGHCLAAGTTRMFTPEATMLLTNKQTLAWLWEDIGQLPESEQEFVTAHIPWTARLDQVDQLDQLDADRAGLVLKPADGFGGSGVVVGAAVDAEQWRAALSSAREQGGHLLQRRVRPDQLPMGFVHAPTGELADAEVPYVLGPFLYGERLAGMLVRHGVPGGGPVLNAGHGAVMNTVLLAGKADHRCPSR